MKPTTLTIYEVFERERWYTVPLFQRAYVWTREDQWEPLWEDIERQARNCLVALSRESQEVKTNHFLGAVVVNAAKVVGRGISRCEVIDGQQRLTTLQVFLAALRDFAEAENEGVAQQVERLTVNPVSDVESDERLKVWPTNADRKVFKTVMTAGSLQEIEAQIRKRSNRGKTQLPRLAEAYSYFYAAITGFVDGAEEIVGDVEQARVWETASRSDRIYAVFHAFKTALLVVAIELEEGDDPQVIFETLNARGQALLPSDLIRNTVFLNASNRGEDIDKLYTSYWLAFDERQVEERDSQGENRFWHLLERQGRLNRPRIDLFIFHDLVVRTERDIQISRLFSEFRVWFNKSQTTTKAYLSSLKNHSDHFARLIVPSGNDRLSVFARRLRSLDTSTVFPILLYLMDLTPTKLETATFTRIIRDLESYLVRRFVCGWTTKNYNRFFLSLLRRIKRASEAGEDLARVVSAELLKQTGRAGIWPSDSDFRKGWLNSAVYVKSRPDRSGMLLQALNAAKQTTMSETIVYSDDLTVEHLLPQAWEDHYPLPENLPPAEDETMEQRRQRLINTVGNLTLLTRPLNASIRNGPFKAKAQEIKQHSDLRLNAQFRQEEFTKWDEHDILQRGQKMFETALRIWPCADATLDTGPLTVVPESTRSWRIGDSNATPRIRADTKPENGSRKVRSSASDTPTAQLYRRFWGELLPHLHKAKPQWSGVATPAKGNLMSFGSARSDLFKYNPTFFARPRRGCRVDAYIHALKVDPSDVFDWLYERRTEIEAEIDQDVEWNRMAESRGCRISVYFADEVRISDEHQWAALIEWIVEAMSQTKSAFDPVIGSYPD